MEDEEFLAIVGPQVNHDMATSLANMLGANASFDISPSAVEYVIGKFWVSDEVYAIRTSQEAEEE